MNIIGHRRIWFGISLAILIPGVISLFLWGLRAGIDFTGGQVMEIAQVTDPAAVRQVFEKQQARDIQVIPSGDLYTVRYREAEGKDPTVQAAVYKSELASIGALSTSFESIGPSVSRDITRNAALSVGLASLAILAFIAVAFRNTPPPVSPLSFGVTAVITLLHDSLLILGVFSLLGHFAHVEIDALFVTAVLTTIGFSVHDTIVVYDRIRENLKKSTAPFEIIVNDSIVETLARSLSTSLTVVFTLLALYIFGGESIRLFVLALLIGIVSGTFSSIFTAAPMLVVWNNRKLKRLNRPKKAAKGKSKTNAVVRQKS